MSKRRITCTKCKVYLGEVDDADGEQALREAHASQCDPDFGK